MLIPLGVYQVRNVCGANGADAFKLKPLTFPHTHTLPLSHSLTLSLSLSLSPLFLPPFLSVVKCNPFAFVSPGIV